MQILVRMGVDAGWKAFDDAVVRTSIGGEFANAKAGVDANIWILIVQNFV